MPTNKEWLYSLDPHELKEWFDAEHGANDTLAAKKVVSVHTGTANDANVSEHVETANGTSDGARAALDAKFDSREKLEADASELTADYAASGDVCDALYGGIVGLLDRQAAITEAKVERKWSCYEGSAQAEIDRLNLCIAELAAKPRSDLAQRMEVDSLENRIFDQQNRIAELRKQRDELQAKLEKSHRDWLVDAGEYEQIVDGMKKQIAELREQVDEKWNMYVATHEKADKLQAELDEAKAKPDCDCCGWQEERDYFKGQFRKCLEAIRADNVDRRMEYPTPEGYVEPYILVTDAIDCGRDFAADVSRLQEIGRELERERDGWRMKCGRMMDAAHEIARIGES